MNSRQVTAKCALLLWILLALAASLTSGQYPMNRKQLTLQDAINLRKRTCITLPNYFPIIHWRLDEHTFCTLSHLSNS